jgi:hypothetical protein
MAATPAEILAHREWLGQIQQVGLVVSPSVLLKQGVFADRQKGIEKQARLRELSETRFDFPTFAHEILEWPDALLSGTPGRPELPVSLTIALPNYEDRLSPTYAVPAPNASDWLALVSVVGTSIDLDRPPIGHAGWRASPHARLERLLRETGVPIGLLFNNISLRLVYAPKGETSGHLTFRFAHLIETLGRPMVSALYALLGVERVTDVSVDEQRLPALLRESRRYQNEVSTALAGQVLEALWELLRGFQRADDDSKGELLREALRQNPGEVYGGLLSTLMRLVFILYAEDRGLMPQADVYQRHYSVAGLFERLREDQARYPDTMDARYGAWAQLLALFRLIHDGGSHGDMRLPARHGRLFDPDAYPFLEGRPVGSARQLGEVVEAPRVPDGTVFRVLQNLLILDGERLSYRALDVEQIGSVYEAMMGFALEVAKAPSIAVVPKHVVIHLEDLLEQKGRDRATWLKEHAELKVTSDALGKATSIPEIVAALGSRVSRYTPHTLTPGAMYLQPTEERRRSGSHYTPRSLTEPIVRTTLRPILERLGDQATPEQILDLKVCDPAMGSGAFLVETCRLLGERLVKAWEDHKTTPSVPEDEDALTVARRLVAERCLYGVDKNIFAVDLAKLSLWLATLACEHPFTFLDHALRHGDSLVGLSREQIACLHWNPGKQLPLIRTFIDPRVAEAQRLREQIQGMGASDDIPEKARLLRDAEEVIAEVRLIGDVVVSAFFEREKLRDRETLRVAYAGKIENWLGSAVGPNLPVVAERGHSGAYVLDSDLRSIRSSLREGDRPIPAFHWEIEFPEVFTRDNPGFDAFVGNPPFSGMSALDRSTRPQYTEWLRNQTHRAGGKCDLVAFFFRRAFALLRPNGTFGLVATNTIAQGDTRASGLEAICVSGGEIFAAVRRYRWPGDAAVLVSVVHVGKDTHIRPPRLDGRTVEQISPFLLPGGATTTPATLKASQARAFRGAVLLGTGFVFEDGNDKATPTRIATDILADDPGYSAVIQPFLGGEELNESPSPTVSHRRYAINFGEMEEDEARRWPRVFSIVQAKVFPERLELRDQMGAATMKRYWWRYARRAKEMYATIGALDRVLAGSEVSQHFAFAFVSPRQVFAHTLNIFADDTWNGFAAIQSRSHEVWVRFLGSTLEDRLRYTPSDCFETFPFPSAWESNPTLSDAGREYYEFRAALMVRNNEGLTKTYNRFHDPEESDPDILKLRELHDAMDRAVFDAYSWTDIQPTCGFFLDYEDDEDETPGKASKRRKPWRYRWPDDVRDQVLGRLLELNSQRAEEERLAGEAAKVTDLARRGRKRRAKRPDDAPLLAEANAKPASEEAR